MSVDRDWDRNAFNVKITPTSPLNDASMFHYQFIFRPVCEAKHHSPTVLQHANPGSLLRVLTLLKKMLIIEEKKIRTEKYIISANWVAMSHTREMANGTANNL